MNDVDMMRLCRDWLRLVEVSIRGANRFCGHAVHTLFSLQNHPSPFFTVHSFTLPNLPQMHPTDSTPPSPTNKTQTHTPNGVNSSTSISPKSTSVPTGPSPRPNLPDCQEEIASRNKSCDIDLDLMANRRKHRKVDRGKRMKGDVGDMIGWSNRGRKKSLPTTDNLSTARFTRLLTTIKSS